MRRQFILFRSCLHLTLCSRKRAGLRSDAECAGTERAPDEFEANG